MADKGRPIIIKKVIKKEEGHHGGSWKVAYADFVTAMMAFFLLLWLLSMVSPEKRAQLSMYFKNFSLFKESGTSFMKGSSQIFDKAGGEATAGRMAVKGTGVKISAEKLQQKIKSQVESKLSALENQILIDVSEGEVRIQLVDTEGNAMFSRGSAQPTESARKIIKLLAENIADTANRVVIEGHTDSVPYRGDQITNWELSTARASAARRELESNGIDPSRIAKVVGFADQELLLKDDPTNPRNRRISIILMKEKEKEAKPVEEKQSSVNAALKRAAIEASGR